MPQMPGPAQRDQRRKPARATSTRPTRGAARAVHGRRARAKPGCIRGAPRSAAPAAPSATAASKAPAPAEKPRMATLGTLAQRDGKDDPDEFFGGDSTAQPVRCVAVVALVVNGAAFVVAYAPVMLVLLAAEPARVDFAGRPARQPVSCE